MPAGSFQPKTAPVNWKSKDLPCRVPNQSICASRPTVRISSPIHELIADGVIGVGRFPAEGAILERHGWIERAEPHARTPAGARIRSVFEVGLGEIDRILVVTVPGRGLDMRREHLTQRLVPGGTQSAESYALVVLVETELAEAVVEE